MKKKIILIATILTSIILFIVTPYLLKELFNNPDTRNTLINYMGALYGGLMTIIGVIATIIYEKEERKKDIELQYKPLIKLEDHDSNNFTTDGELDIITSDKGEYTFLKKCLLIKNVGRGEMINIELSNVYVEAITEKNKECNGYLSTGYKFEELAPNNELSYSITILSKKNKKFNIYNVSLKLSFYGCMNKVKNTYLIGFSIYNNSLLNEDKLYNYRVTKM